MRFTGKSVGGGEILTRCPKCGREKLYVNVFKQLGFCQRCGLSLGPREIRDGFIKPSDREVLNLRQVPSLIEAWHDKDARAYLQGRGITPDDDYILYDPKGRRLYFHIFSPSPEYQPSYHTRSIDPDGGWVVFPGTKKAHYIYEAGSLPKYTARIMLVEGIWDALAVGAGAVALLGTKMSETVLQYLRNGNAVRSFGMLPPVWLWLDPDEAGIEASFEINKRLCDAGIQTVMILADKEPSETDPAERQKILRNRWWMT